MSIDVTFKNVLDFLDCDNLFVFLLVEILVVVNYRILCLVCLVNDRSRTIADYLFDFIVGFDFNRVVYFLLKACLFDLLHCLGALLELPELDLLKPASQVLAIFCAHWVELEHVRKLLGKHS